MPTLNWIGKEKIVTHHQDVPFHVLEHRYGFTAGGGRQEAETRSGNMIIHGDNLVALKALLPMYEGRVDCIYIDPPYNTGNESWVYNDNVNEPHIRKWLNEVVGKQGEDLSRHDKWLCMMYPRLVLLHKLLSPTGAIFVSIDDNEVASLRLILDEIFGQSCFVADVIWRSADSSNNDSKQFSNDYNHTLVFSKEQGWQPLRFERKAENNQHYKNPDNDPRGPWCAGNLSSPNPRPNLRYEIIAPNGNVIEPPKNGWRWSKERMDAMIAENIVVFSEDNKRIIKKTFLKDQAGIVPSNIWWNIEETGHNRNAKYELLKIFSELHSSQVFSTPKPTKFIDRILQLFPNNITILDSFGGSGTTAHSVLKMNKKDDGIRKFVLVEMMDYAETVTAERVRRVMKGYGSVPGLGGAFDYYELGERLFDDNGFLNEGVGTDKIRQYVYYSETGEPLREDCRDVSPYLLGRHDKTDYYFYYEPQAVTCFGPDTADIIVRAAEQCVVYADTCLFQKEDLARRHIIFKKIPRDIKRF